MKQFSFKFQVSGLSQSHGEFSQVGKGSMKLDESKFSDGGVQAEMIKEAVDFFIKITQPSKTYKGVSDLSVKVFDIKVLD